MEQEHPEIPTGHYCYTVNSVNAQTGVVYTKVCPHWKSRLVNGWPAAYCSLLKIESQHQESQSLIWDQVKECDINNGGED